MKITKYLPVVAATMAALISSSSFADSADARFRIGDISFGIDIGTPPPAPIVEYVPAAMPGRVWMPGYWAWNGHRHIWNGGAWERVRPGYRHVAGHWEQRGERWHFEPSRWDAHKFAEHRRDRHDHAQHAWYDGHRDKDSFRGRDARRDYSR